MGRFAIDTISVFSSADSAATTLRAVGSASHSLRRQTTGPNSSNTYDEARYTLDLDDEVSLGGVLAIKTLLSLVSPLIGKCVVEDTGKFGLRLFGQSLDRCGTKGRGASGTHAQVTAAKGHMLVTDFGGSKNQLATANVRIVNLSADGTAAPTTTVYNASLPGTFTYDEAFKIGPVQLGGVALTADEITSVQVSTGINVEVIKDPASGYATNLLILKAQPTIRIGVEGSDVLASGIIPYAGKACTHANSYMSLVQLDSAGTIKALDGSHHIKGTFAGRAYIEDHLNGGGAAAAGATIVVETTEASGTAPLVITTDTNLV